MLTLPYGGLLVELLGAFTAAASPVRATATFPFPLALTFATHGEAVMSTQYAKEFALAEDGARSLALKPKTLRCTYRRAVRYKIVDRVNETA